MPSEKDSNYIAHRRARDGVEQTLETHLIEVGEIAGHLASKIGVAEAGQLLGLLHDFGKYSRQFQNYIGSAIGKINPDEDEYVDFKGLKGKIDHSSAGAQWIWQKCSRYGKHGKLVGQILALCIASHHSGLIDCLKPEGENGFLKRMSKPDEYTNLTECLENSCSDFFEKIEKQADKLLIQSILKQIQLMARDEQHGQKTSDDIKKFYIGFWTRMLFSCLIDADRMNSADFEQPENSKQRRIGETDWNVAIERCEKAISEFATINPIDHIRRDISNNCKQRARQDQGIYSLTVPTGGGKTYASLRFALHHAQKHKLERIIYVIPYTSIIEQNAQAIRDVLECSADEFPWVLEHHSNLEPETQTWHSKLASENWDSPIILTTMVQFLEVLFSGGTRGVRRMHQLANSILIFDEIQTLPIKCTHLFCNAINFLTTYASTTSVLCTATQPLLNGLRKPERGQLSIQPGNELVPDVPKLFKDLKRVDIINKVRPEGWNAEQITELAVKEFEQCGSCLVIVNTKYWAKKLYDYCKVFVEESALFHLSTNLCPAHRKALFSKIKKRLKENQPVLCISTQLVEAGVDIDFASVIRFLAGLDSIHQAAGRCNRNGKRGTSIVHVVNPDQEAINMLVDIKEGRDKALRVFSELGDGDILCPEVMNRYFQYYFYERADEMTYPLSARHHARDDNLLNLLCDNSKNPSSEKDAPQLQQSFMEAGKLFKALDVPTKAVIVSYGEGNQIISELCGYAREFDAQGYRVLLKQAQNYSVNVFPNIWKTLEEAEAIHEIQPGEGIYFLEEQHYSQEFGLSTKKVSLATFLNF